ncbi:hypothetical protein NP590_06945 [Methylomonas sp. SURF-2]|uniref:Uncharacterized protein n=1 Tax=Methylomonas subterranea TaxID=2952225 RepID=A0ABT1TEF7_9GAMM|nr:hypothetical protein [Methylomonas sp. SURF-2]MCQ8103835.1 hypothetical protein [Methylomonas sp. SURF-2]
MDKKFDLSADSFNLIIIKTSRHFKAATLESSRPIRFMGFCPASLIRLGGADKPGFRANRQEGGTDMKNKTTANNDLYKTMGYAALMLSLSLPLSILVMQIFDFILDNKGI